ncbi:MAG: M14 family zinc carboxypeptidase [Planctomycetota bacterium]|nr:M14 family zinc carboxypeptidase [Planctomycetota bacterium]
MRSLAPYHLLLLAATLLAGVLMPCVGCAARARAERASAAAGVWEPVGFSVRGQPILATTIAPPAGAMPPRVLIVGGIHGNEREGLPAVDPLVEMLGRDSAGAHVRVVRDLNPDGTAARSRGNARGVDLNRNFPASNFSPSLQRGPAALSEPESNALAGELARFRPHVVIVFHSIARGPFVNFDGPGEALASAFVSGAAPADGRWRVEPSMGYPTPGSLGTLVGVDGGTPILTVEFLRGHDAPTAIASALGGVRAVLLHLRDMPGATWQRSGPS